MEKVINGTITYTSKCIGCRQDFENIRLVGEPKDDNPVCNGCIKTMEP